MTMRLIAGLLLIVASGCALVGPPTPRPGATPVLAEGPAIEPGGESEILEGLASDLMRRGEDALSANDADRARALAQEVIRRYPRSRGSARALWIEGEGARRQGDRVAAVQALFRIPAQAEGELRERSLRLARSLAGEMADPELRDLLEEAPPHPWILPPFQIAFAERRRSLGDLAGARPWAEAVLALTPDTIEREIASQWLGAGGPGGEVAEGLVPALSLALVLSDEGPPGLAQLSRQIRSGVELALLQDGVRGRVQLFPLEDGGDPSRGAAIADAVRQSEVSGVLGPLTDAVLRAATQGVGEVVYLSPTARMAPSGSGEVYSIGGVDPAAARVLAGLVWRDGVREVVVFHRRDAEEERELEAFRASYESLGGRIRQTFSYLPGATTFEEAMRGMRRLNPAAIVLFTPPEDAELVAPQLSFYEVDAIPGLRRYGGSGWSSRGVLDLVPTRHTDGMRTITAHVGPGFGPAWEPFVQAYESQFQRSLRNPAPALGWDAALILLEAARLGDGTPAGVARGLRQIRGLDGATGHFFWSEGQISRRFVPVEIRDRTLHPMDD